MPGVARGSAVDSVAVPHGAGVNCASPMTSSTDELSGDVFVNGTGVVRKDDKMTSHPNVGCIAHAPGLSTHSLDVFANGLQIGDLGDQYGCGGVISSASTDVFANGPNPSEG